MAMTTGRRSPSAFCHMPALSRPAAAPSRGRTSSMICGSGWNAVTGSICRPSGERRTTAQKSPVAREMFSATRPRSDSMSGTASLKASVAAAMKARRASEDPGETVESCLTGGTPELYFRRPHLPPNWRIGLPRGRREARPGNVDAVSAHRHALLDEEIPLPPTLGDSAIRPNDAVPGQALMGGGEDATDQPRRFGIDVAVSAHRARGNPADPLNDHGHPRLGQT